MVSLSQGWCSTNWKPLFDESNRATSTSETPSVISVVHSAIQRAFRFAASSFPLRKMRRKEPTRGKRMIVVRIGQSFIA